MHPKRERTPRWNRKSSIGIRIKSSQRLIQKQRTAGLCTTQLQPHRPAQPLPQYRLFQMMPRREQSQPEQSKIIQQERYTDICITEKGLPLRRKNMTLLGAASTILRGEPAD